MTVWKFKKRIEINKNNLRQQEKQLIEYEDIKNQIMQKRL